jgi:hypothetical protein
VGDHGREGVIGRGEVLPLIQRSARRREFELRRDGALVGWLRFPRGRRSVAEAWAGAVGSLALTAGSGRVEVRGDGDGGAIVATVERARRGAWVVRVAGAPALGWRRSGPGHRWAVDGDGGTLLRLAATQGLLRASVRVTVQQAMPERSAELLCLLGGFLALRELQAEVDAGAAVGGIVAAGAG